MMHYKKYHQRNRTSRQQECNNTESRNIGQEQKQTFDLDMAEITPSILDEYPGTSTAIHTGSENRLSEKHIPPYQEFF